MPWLHHRDVFYWTNTSQGVIRVKRNYLINRVLILSKGGDVWGLAQNHTTLPVILTVLMFSTSMWCEIALIM